SDFKCVLCNSEGNPKLVSNTVKGDREKALTVVSCPNCSHFQLFPPLYSLQHYNQDDQVNFVVHDYGTPLERIIEHSWLDALRRVKRFSEKGIEINRLKKPEQKASLIDVGGGY